MIVWINAWEDDVKLASELSWACTKRTRQPLTNLQLENVWTQSIMEAPIGLLDSVSKYQASALKETNTYIFTLGPRMIPWDKIPPRRRHLVTRWVLEKNRLVRQWKAIARTRKVKMLGIEATLANPQRAKSLGIDDEE